MNENLYSLVYCSRIRIPGSDEQIKAELESILASSRKNNPAIGVTGALIYNGAHFAQVLEGPLHSVERIFEIIQRDSRHSEVRVIQSGAISQRNFSDWSMAFAGSNETEKMPLATEAFAAVFSNGAGAGEKMLNTLKGLVVRENDWVLLDTA
jgi:hypothetical protein